MEKILEEMEALNQKGLEFQKNKMLRESLSLFDSALQMREHPVLYYNSGNSYFGLKDYTQASLCYEKSIEMGFDNPDVLANLGTAYHKLQKFKEASDFYSKSLSIRKDREVEFNFCLLYRDSGHVEYAIDSFLQLVKDYPDFSEAYSNLSELFYLKKDYKNCEVNAKKAIEINPKSIEAYINLGKMHMKKLNHNESLKAHLESLKIKGPSADVFCNIASALINLDRFDEALAYLKKSYDLDPKLIQIPLYLAKVARFKGQYDQELECREKALEGVEPRQAEIAQKTIEYEYNYIRDGISLDEYKDLMIFYFDYALFCLSKKNYSKGWPYYDLRWETPDCWGIKKEFHVPCVKDKKEPIESVYIWGEQGLGDSIMFANLLRNFEKLKVPYYLAVESRLTALFSRSFNPKKILGLRKDRFGDSAVPVDVTHHLPMGSLYRVMDLKSFDKEVDPAPYLTADPALLEKMKDYKRNFKKPLVGISWKSFNETLGPLRSLDINSLKKILSFENVTWVSLQYSVSDEERQFLQEWGIEPIESPVDVFNDIEGLSALLSVLDLTLSVDNTTAHLSAALGAPTWILLPKNPDWRWTYEGEKSIWYQSAQLWRQEQHKSWDDVVEKVMIKLTEDFQS